MILLKTSCVNVACFIVYLPWQPGPKSIIVIFYYGKLIVHSSLHLINVQQLMICIMDITMDFYSISVTELCNRMKVYAYIMCVYIFRSLINILKCQSLSSDLFSHRIELSLL